MITTINLLPWRELKRERSKLFFFIGLGVSAGLSAIIAVVTFFILENNLEHQQNRNHLIENEIAFYNGKIARIRKLKSIRASLIARMKVIQKLQESRTEIVHFFDELVKIVPRSIYLLKVERIGDSIMLTGHTDANSSVSLMMHNIRRNFWLNYPSLEEVEEVTNQRKNKLYNQFRVKIVLKPKNKLNPLGEAFNAGP